MAVPLYKPGTSTPWATLDTNIPLNDAFAAECAETIERMAALDDPGKIRYLHLTDIHIGARLDDNRRMCLSALAYMAKEIAADFILLTGDIITGATGDAEVQQSALNELREIFADCNVPVIVSRGNHDDNSIAGLSAENIVTNTWWNWYMATGINGSARDFVTPANGNGYFYVDIPKKKLRVVNINSSDLTDEERLTTGGQNYQVVSAAQLDWLSSVAFNVEAGWKIICACHVTAVDGMPHNFGISNDTELYAVLQNHADKIIAYNCGHGHMTANYKDPTTGIYFLMGNTCGGSTINATSAPAGYGYSSVSKEAKDAAPTGAMLFDICIVNEDETISRVRWGAEDDVFRD